MYIAIFIVFFKLPIYAGPGENQLFTKECLIKNYVDSKFLISKWSAEKLDCSGRF